MKLFLSGDLGSKDGERTLAPLIHNRLLSYYYNVTKSNEPDEVLLSCKPRKQGVLLDSGAYSAFNIGAKIDVQRFGAFCVKYAGMFDLIASLDVIGDATASDKNYQILHDVGATKVFPTFHYGEPFSFLEKMKKASKVIGIGGVAQLGGGRKLITFMDECWRRLSDAKGKPTHDVHGFAVGSGYLIQRYPWYSVDTASWVVAPVWGHTPVLRGGIIQNITVTKIGAIRQKLGGSHYDVMPKDAQKWFRDYIAQVGLTLEDVQDGTAVGTLNRQRVSVYSYQLLEKTVATKMQSHQMTLE